MHLFFLTLLSIALMHILFFKDVGENTELFIALAIGTSLWGLYEWCKLFIMKNEDSLEDQEMLVHIFGAITPYVVLGLVALFFWFTGIKPFFDEINAPQAAPYQSNTFEGYPCTGNCNGHEAGYDWAQEHSITDPDDCGGNSNSFIEGCTAWAEKF